MKKLLILALASAFSVVATATTSNWFRGASNGSQLTSSNATWSNTAGLDITYDAQNNIVLDLDSRQTLELTPNANTAPDTNTVTVVNISDAVFTPCAFDSIDADLTNGVQTALTVAYENGATNYYAHSKGAWVALDQVQAPSPGPVSVTIEMNYYTASPVTATFKIGGSEQTIEVGTTSRSVGSVSLAGNGKVASLAASVELGVAQDSSRKYPSLADAVKGGSNAITLLRDTNEDITLSQGVAFNTNGKNYTGSVSPASGADIQSDSGTYTAIQQYFPRTGTSGQDGSQAHPYEVADVDDLEALASAVGDTTIVSKNYAGAFYSQTANINMSGAGAFAGIGTYAANLNSGVPFKGTYDGQGYTISNVDFTQRNYGGIFNQVKGGTIKNLTVDTITCSEFDGSVNKGEWGCAIVGNAGQGATLQNLTANGNFGSVGVPCTHNVAGIAIRLCGGSSNVVNGVTMLETLVQNCTNNATLYGNYTKCAGIAALTQDQNGVPNDYVLFDGCVNNANIAMTTGSKAGQDGLSGILAHGEDSATLVNCVNNGSLSSSLEGARIGGLIGYAWTDKTNRILTFTDLGGNSTVSTQKMVGYVNSSDAIIDGFQYATVDNGVATTVTGALAKDTTYLLEGNVAASETPVFTLIALDDYITFDKTLGYTFAGTVAAGNGLVAHKAESGNVITYKAYGDAEVANDAAETAAQDIGISDDVAKEALETDMKDWIASGAVTAAELDANPTNVMNRARDTGNKLTLLQCYVLNLNATNANATVKAEIPEGGKTEGSGTNTKILIKVPTPRNDTGYTVKYQIKSWNGSAWDNYGDPVDYDKIKIPVGTGRYRVDVELQK